MAIDAEKIDALFAPYDRGDTPGCALADIEDGRVAYERGYGMADIERGERITPRSAFYIASVSKHFTCACIVLLAQRGAISLDDDIRRYVPQLPDYGKHISIRHLIHHTSGLRDNLDLWAAAGRSFVKPFDNEDCMALVRAQRGVNFAPGQQHLYCNTGYKLMAELVPRVTGQSLRQFAENELFRPLGMQHTFFDDNNEKIARRVVSYRERNGKFLPQEKAFTIVGSGGLVTTVEDLFLWDQNFYHHRVGGSELVEQLGERGRLNDGTLLDYAFGLSHGVRNGLSTIGHGGAMLGFRTHLLRFPSIGFSVVVLGNVDTFDAYARARQVADICLAERYPLAQFTGSFRCQELDKTFGLYAREGSLVTYLAGERIQLESAGADCFSGSGFTLTFCRRLGRVQGFVLDTGRAQGMVFNRVAARRRRAGRR